jgi:catechol 2,3-dioxygenase-like lactoylglutathione lyase family enzyme
MNEYALRSHDLVAFVATTNPARAKEFFAKTLGLRLVSEDSFALVFDAAGTMLRVATVPELQPAAYTVLGWQVPDIQRTVRALKDRGVEFRRYEWMPQDQDGIWTAPGGAQVAWFGDPDGNTLSLTQFTGRRARKRAKPAGRKSPRLRGPKPSKPASPPRRGRGQRAQPARKR